MKQFCFILGIVVSCTSYFNKDVPLGNNISHGRYSLLCPRIVEFKGKSILKAMQEGVKPVDHGNLNIWVPDYNRLNGNLPL